MTRWTRVIVRNRGKILACWIVAFVLGAWAASGLGHLLSNRFSIPGSQAQKGLDLLKKRMGERSDGAFTLVVQAEPGRSLRDPALTAEAEQAAARGATALANGKSGPLVRASDRLGYVQLSTSLENADSSDRTSEVRGKVGHPPGMRTYLSGFPAINHDTQPIYNHDLARGEMIAVPVALLVMGFMFGTLAAIAIPLLFALITIPITLGFVWIAAHYLDMAVYVTNIVTLIGLAIAIDYSMLVVFRYREELAAGHAPADALERTMATAGRATLFSGMTVALGLALLMLMPLPFMRSMGLGGLVVPLVSIAASATLLPAVLSLMGARVNRLRVVPRAVLEKRASGEAGLWTRLARSIMRRPVRYLAAAAAVMLALAWPVTHLHLTSGDNRGIPLTTEATRGLALLEHTLGPGALAPHQIVVDTGRRGGAYSAGTLAAERRLVSELRGDPLVAPATVQALALLHERPGPPPARTLALARRANLVDATGQVIQIRASGHTDAGTKHAETLVHRIRDRYLPAAGFPAAREYVTGAPAFGVDFIHRAYSAFPWLVLAVLVLSYVLLLRAFRSLVLPGKAVLLNVLSVAATYGVLVLVFQHGLGDWAGFGTTPQIDAWIPIFLFAILFGLSMDYEVFLLSRMREEWDHRGDNTEAVARGLEHTGRIITAAAIIMVAAFSGFTAGSFVSLQEFGLGLSAAILLDATIVRALLVPAAMKLLGRWNWYLPARVARALRLRPSLAEPEPARPGA